MDFKEKANLYSIKGIRIIYAYALNVPGLEGYLKISDHIFPLSFEDIKVLNRCNEKEISELYFSNIEEITASFGGKLIGVWSGRFKGENSDLQITASDVVGEFDNMGVDKIVHHNGTLYKADSNIIENALSHARKIAEDNYNKKYKKATANKSSKKKAQENEPPSQPLFRTVSFRPEQKKAIEETVKHFEGGKSRFLWNAKMRFGKTLSALEVAKRRGYDTTLIITHRPVVDASWEEDFKKIFHTNEKDRTTYFYGRRDEEKEGNEFEGLLRKVEEGGKLVFFVSMQYLRLSKLANGKEKNINEERNAILNYPWDFVVIDEAHEGTKSDKGANVMYYMHLDVPEESTQNVITVEDYQESEGESKTPKEDTRLRAPRTNEPDTLSLSGTPFNLFNDFNADEVFTWDYVKEQKAKKDWSLTHDNDPNPYDVLPKLHIFNNDMKEDMGINIEEKDDNGKQKDFTFSLLFETKNGKFKYEDQVKKFLVGLITAKEGTNYPFSTPEFREAFKHTFWLVPGVKEGKALKDLMEKEDEWIIDGEKYENIFKKLFHIVNVCGTKNDETEDKGNKDLQRVQEAIRKVNSNEIKGVFKERDVTKRNTITLSCGKLTTGVSVPEWTAVFYLKGGDDTAASAYLQAIFRVQTPAVIDGYQKTDCYVFDFAPTRSLKVFADAVRLNLLFKDKTDKTKSRTATEEEEREEKELSEWLEYCPLVPLAGDNSVMAPYSAKTLFDELNKRLTEKAVNSGFSDNSVFSMAGIMSISEEMFKELAGAINGNGAMDKVETFYVKRTEPRETGSGRNKKGRTGKGKKEEKTEAEIQREEYLKERKNRLTTLKAMAKRIPLLMYGADVDDKINPEAFEIKNFLKLFESDEESWKEFMPKGVTIKMFESMIPAFDPRVFRNAALKIRAKARQADELQITERIKAIAEIFDHFNNPDKETVLTSWRVVNMHMSQTLGGYNFFDDDFKEAREGEPEFVDQGEVTKETIATDKTKTAEERNNELDRRHILEINSKTGLYPLYVAYSLFRDRKDIYESAEVSDRSKKDDNDIWEETLRDNLFVVCKTPMAKAITRRTLAGFLTSKENGVDTGRPLQVNAICPEWELPKKDLVKKNILKNPEGIEIPEDEKYNSDLVTVLRYDSSLFEKNVIKPDWWERGGREEGAKDETVQIQLDKLSAKDMINFNAVVGNPPYQETLDAGRGLAKQLFPGFIETGIKLFPNYLSLITPSRWFTADAQDNSFPKLREFVKSNNHFFSINSHNGKNLFPKTELGMVNYFLWIKNYIGNVKFIENNGDTSNCIERPLFEKDLDIIISQNSTVSIIKKIKKTNFTPLNTITTGRDAFGIVGKGFEQRSKNKQFSNYIGVQCAYEQIRFIPRSEVKKGLDILDKYKVFTSKGNGGAGLLTDGKQTSIIGKSFIGTPGTACTDSLIPFGKFSSIEEAKHLQTYMRTKFLRFCVGILKVSQNLYQNVYELVPLQDFTENSDIDWSQGIAEIDKQLYTKYGLDKNEIKFIESMIKPME